MAPLYQAPDRLGARHKGVPQTEPILQLRDVLKNYGPAEVLTSASYDLHEGKSLSIGESGSGECTTSRPLLRLEEASAGQACYCGRDLFTPPDRDLLRMRRDIQVVFQKSRRS